MIRRIISVTAVLALLLGGRVLAGVDPALADYTRVAGVSGTLSSIGSDTLNNLMSLWAQEFTRFYPNVTVQVQGAGSSTAPVALAEGTASLAPMSRIMRAAELRRFENRYGYAPLAIPVAIDMLVIYVNKDNPLPGLNLQQLDAIFSVGRRCGAAQGINRWGQLGLSGHWRERDISVYSRNAVSGTYGFFREHALCGGDFKASIHEQPGSASVVQSVSASLNGIGYAGIGYHTSGVRVLPLAATEQNWVEASVENAISGRYPLARFLYVYVNRHPQQGLAVAEREFVRFMLSQQGQQAVQRDGYVPLPATLVNDVLRDIDGRAP